MAAELAWEDRDWGHFFLKVMLFPKDAANPHTENSSWNTAMRLCPLPTPKAASCPQQVLGRYAGFSLRCVGTPFSAHGSLTGGLQDTGGLQMMENMFVPVGTRTSPGFQSLLTSPSHVCSWSLQGSSFKPSPGLHWRSYEAESKPQSPWCVWVCVCLCVCLI